VADGALPEAARAVDVLAPLGVPEQRALAAHPHDGRIGMADDRMRVDDVRGIEPRELLLERLLRRLRHTAFLTVFNVVYSSIVCGPCS
jgi:hypothetical protein